MNIHTQRLDGVVIVYLKGELTSQNSGHTYDELVRIAKIGDKRVVVHVGEVTSLTRAGARGLLVASKLIRGAGGEMRICGGDPSVVESLIKLGFNELIRRYRDISSARKHPWRDGGVRHAEESGPEFKFAI